MIRRSRVEIIGDFCFRQDAKVHCHFLHTTYFRTALYVQGT